MFETTQRTKRTLDQVRRGGMERARRIFVAEGDPRMRELICTALRLDGHEVVEAGDGQALVAGLVESLTAPQPRAPDLIVLEVRLPRWSGLEILQRLRRFDLETPVILLCQRDDHALVEQAVPYGVSCVLEYPFDYGELRRLATEALCEPS